MITIGRLGLTRRPTEAEIRAGRDAFAERHCVRLPGVLPTDLLAALQALIDRAAFEECVHDGIGPNRELCLRSGAAVVTLHLLFNTAALFDLVRRITGSPPIGCVVGRVYRMVPGGGHHDAWHDDLSPSRLVAMSLNLSRRPFTGGVLQIRDRASGAVVHEVANTGPGDVVLFRLARTLQHRVTEVEGDAPKTAFAGWFQSEPGFRALIGPAPGRPRRPPPR